jgi:hypothetical protein
MQDILNPASRLLVLLRSALPGDPNQQLTSVWATLFDLPDQSEMSVVRCLVAMSDCIDETKRLLGTREGINLALFTSEFSSIEAVIAPGALRQSRAQVLTPYLQPTVLTRLEFCAEELRRFYKEEPIPPEDLLAIQSTVEELFKQVFDSDIDSVLRIVLLEELEKLRAALVMYRIRGAKGLADACRSLLGTLGTQGLSTAAATAEAKPLLGKFAQIIKQVSEVTKNAMSIYKAIQGPVNSVIGLLGYDAPLPNIRPDTEPSSDADV